MNDDNMYKLKFNPSKPAMPRIGGKLPDEQLAEVEVWKHVPPFDGFTFQLENTNGVMGSSHQQILAGFRGMVLSELISIEYLLAAVPLADELKDETDFSLKFWERMNQDGRTFGQRIAPMEAWIDGRLLQGTQANFNTAIKVLSDVRNSLAHYPIQAAFNGTNDTLTPFVYRASKDQMLIFDDHKILVVETFCNMVKNELQQHFIQLKPV